MRVRVLITGAHGFIGKNLSLRLSELEGYEILKFCREDSIATLQAALSRADAVIHLAGSNRPKNLDAFTKDNKDFTELICNLIKKSKRVVPFLLASSIQAELENPYALSKLGAEAAAQTLSESTDCPVIIYRLPNVFGKWCRPNYNSVVGTFCHNIANNLSIQINDPAVQLRLVYVDDVVDAFIQSIRVISPGLYWKRVEPEYSIQVGDLAAQIKAFQNCRESLFSEPVGTGLVRALYATYVSYLSPLKFTYHLPKYGDKRGIFVEILKTKNFGQFSFFTAQPGVTRGGHYHHTKSEKFLVVKGNARFRFRHVLTNEVHEVFTNGSVPKVVETVPGWVHDITNMGQDEMVVMLWANEVFDRERPDTIASEV